MPESEPMLTIRPSPAARMAVNAARQHRNEPVRLTPSVSSQMSHVVSANGADVSTPAAQTRAARPAGLRGGGKQPLDIFDLAHICGYGRGLAAGGLDAAGDAGESVAVPGRENDVRPGAGQGLGGGGSDSPAGARDHRDPSRQPVPGVTH